MFLKKKKKKERKFSYKWNLQTSLFCYYFIQQQVCIFCVFWIQLLYTSILFQNRICATLSFLVFEFLLLKEGSST